WIATPKNPATVSHATMLNVESSGACARSGGAAKNADRRRKYAARRRTAHAPELNGDARGSGAELWDPAWIRARPGRTPRGPGRAGNGADATSRTPRTSSPGAGSGASTGRVPGAAPDTALAGSWSPEDGVCLPYGFRDRRRASGMSNPGATEPAPGALDGDVGQSTRYARGRRQRQVRIRMTTTCWTSSSSRRNTRAWSEPVKASGKNGRASGRE